MEREDNLQAYNAEYYLKHREELSAAKKKRYQEDPVYRETVKTKSRARKKVILEERRSLRKMGLLTFKRAPLKYQIEVDGRNFVLKMMTAGQLAKVLDRGIQTVRLWEKRGLLPRALYRSAAGDRLYTEFQVRQLGLIYQQVVAEFGSLIATRRIGQTSFRTLAHELWLEYPLGFDLNVVQKGDQ